MEPHDGDASQRVLDVSGRRHFLLHTSGKEGQQLAGKEQERRACQGGYHGLLSHCHACGIAAFDQLSDAGAGQTVFVFTVLNFRRMTGFTRARKGRYDESIFPEKVYISVLFSGGAFCLFRISYV